MSDHEHTSGEHGPAIESNLQRRLEADSAGLAAALGEQLRAAPWYMGSIGIHLVIFALLMALPSSVEKPAPKPSIIELENVEEPEELTEEQEEVEDEIIEIIDAEIVPVETNLTEAVLEFTEQVIEPTDSDVVEVVDEVFDEVVVPEIAIEAPTATRTSSTFAKRTSASARRRAMTGQTGKIPPTVIEQRLKDALEWLKAHQESDGKWIAAKYGGNADSTNVAVTSMATLAFLGAGNSHKNGPYRNEVSKAVRWLANQQQSGKDEGRIGPHRYVHALALMAVTEAYAMSGNDSNLRSVAQKAVDYACRTQCPDGGWDYAPSNGKRSDFSVAGWFIMGLKSGKQAGLKVDKNVMDKALKFAELMTHLTNVDPNDPWKGTAQGRYAANGQGGNIHGGSTAMTAVSLTTLQFLERPRTDPRVRLAGQTVIRNGAPKVGTTQFYRWYYGALGLYQYGADPELRDDPTMKPYVDAWRAWSGPMVDTLMKMQVRTGTYKQTKGSWNPETEGSHGRNWGRVGQTALGALMLEVFFRYDFVQQSRRAMNG